MKTFTIATLSLLAASVMAAPTPAGEALEARQAQIGTATIQLFAAAATFPPFTIPVSQSGSAVGFTGYPNGGPPSINYNLVTLSGLPNGETCTFYGLPVNGKPAVTFTFGNTASPGAAFGPPGPLASIVC